MSGFLKYNAVTDLLRDAGVPGDQLKVIQGNWSSKAQIGYDPASATITVGAVQVPLEREVFERTLVALRAARLVD